MKYIVSFPHIGNYYIVVSNLLRNILNNAEIEILIPKKTTKDTLNKGSNSSPDFICAPFKYNMGNYIEALENGANVLIQAGGGCRYGYYAEVQEQILRDLGYQFTYISLFEPEGINVINVFKKFKKLNPNLALKDFTYYGLLAIKSVYFLDEIEKYIRDNYVLVKDKIKLEKIYNQFLNNLKKVNSVKELDKLKKAVYCELKSLENISKEEQMSLLKVGIIGELYSLMEPFASFNLEKKLSKYNVKVKRYTTVTYLLFQKSKSQNKLIKKANKYIEYALGADGTESVAHTLELIEKGYDGIIHIKPFGCTPEENAIPILERISREQGIPIMYMTFDEQTSDVGVDTRIEAFYDMISMKKLNKII